MGRRQRRRQASTPHAAHTATVTSHAGRVSQTTRLKPPRFRPRWHKAAGVGMIAAGASLFFACELSLLGIHRYGGHIWYIVGMVVAAGALWWFGAFDPAGSGFA